MTHTPIPGARRTLHRAQSFWRCILMLAAALSVTADTAFAQPGKISLGSLRTEAKRQAVRVAAEYFKNLPGSFFASSDKPKATGEGGWWLDVAPEARLLTGDDDAFQGVVAKLTGNFARFHAKELAPGVWVVDYDRTWWVFPLSVGAESDGAFRVVNAVAEVGIVPIFRNQFRNPNQLWVGLFLQGGYKFDAGATDATAPDDDVGGSADESEEQLDDALARAKLEARLQVPVRLTKDLELRLIGSGAGWYDIVNSTTYHRLEGTLRIPLTADKYFDFTYERGAGAPTFNKGEQFSANLTIAF